MAKANMFEYKTVQVSNNEDSINFCTSQAAKFFWEVKNIQVTHVKDSHLEDGGVNMWGESVINSVTETQEYATITMQRDKTMPFYDELSALENEYTTLSKLASLARFTDESEYHVIILGIICIVLISLIGLAPGFATIVLALLGFAGMAGFCFYVHKSNVSLKESRRITKEKYDTFMETFDERLNEITDKIENA